MHKSFMLLSLFLCSCSVQDKKTSQKDDLIKRNELFIKDKVFKKCCKIHKNADRMYFYKVIGDSNYFCMSDMNGKILTKIQMADVYEYDISANGDFVIFSIDNANENNQAICVNLKKYQEKQSVSCVKNLTPFDNIKVYVKKISQKHPDKILIAMNKDDKTWFDIYRCDLNTGKLDLVLKNRKYSLSNCLVDDDLNVKFISETTSDGGMNVYYLNGEKIELFEHIAFNDVTSVSYLFLSKDNEYVYKLEAINTDLKVLVKQNIKTKAKEILFSSDKEEIASIVADEDNKEVLYINTLYLKPKSYGVNKYCDLIIQEIAQKFSKNDCILINGKIKHYILFSVVSDIQFIKRYLYDSKNKKIIDIYGDQRKVKDALTMKPVVIKSRDGLDLVCYLTMSKKSHQNLIVLVHGGPKARDVWGYSQFIQFLGNRGYNVLTVNYRGSVGFGKKFVTCADGNLDKVHNDILDVVKWAIDNNITTKDKVAVVGASFGGYAALRCLTHNPSLFKCGISICGVSNWLTLVNSVPKYWVPELIMLYKLFAGNDVKNWKKHAKKHSPINYIQNIQSPLLLIQGGKDVRVTPAEALQMYDGVKKKVDATYVLYENEGHGIETYYNMISAYAYIEQFLAKHIGGKCEELSPLDILTNSYKVVGGGEHFGINC